MKSATCRVGRRYPVFVTAPTIFNVGLCDLKLLYDASCPHFAVRRVCPKPHIIWRERGCQLRGTQASLPNPARLSVANWRSETLFISSLTTAAKAAGECHWLNVAS